MRKRTIKVKSGNGHRSITVSRTASLRRRANLRRMAALMGTAGIGKKAGTIFANIGVGKKLGVKKYIKNKPLSAVGLATLSGLIVGYFLHK